jgi:hypothetical protein
MSLLVSPDQFGHINWHHYSLVDRGLIKSANNPATLRVISTFCLVVLSIPLR